ncbi:FkbM family methyltransferase [Lyngbya sp. PCC 8106]|uniref:FkbM family methyltransferase n=1 Tax=Lyngbya sp. (strain PCC 8106) TaxID=313612 RepID=UPI0000EAC7E1|nr:FkbM family methyltransferase [Lyngbya sp. PCC 8106]EAW38826.1 Methyltransferase FkbM [Lyngbya sp. PCC 8106]
MNWRYFIGKSLAILGNSILASKMMPLIRFIPVGISYPYDIKRFSKDYQFETIFDVGANIGQTSLFLSKHFPQAGICAFEPVHKTFNQLCTNTKIKNKIKPFNYAMGAQEEELLISIRENSELNTLVRDGSKNPVLEKTVETVKVTTIDTFCQQQYIEKIDLLKMDVQGFELEVLKGAEFYLKNNLISFIYAEVSFENSNKECQLFEDLYYYLNNNNFRLSGFYEVFRWGADKRYFGFCNALFVNCSL